MCMSAGACFVNEGVMACMCMRRVGDAKGRVTRMDEAYGKRESQRKKLCRACACDEWRVEIGRESPTEIGPKCHQKLGRKKALKSA